MGNNYSKLINQLDQIIKENGFKQNLLELIKKCIYQYDCSEQLHKGYAIFTSKFNGNIYDLKVIFSDNEVKYVYSSSDAQDNETGIYKKTVNQTFTNVCKYTIANHGKQSHLTKEHTISIFDNNMVEQFKYVANDYQSYYIKDGEKCFTPNVSIAFNNMLNIRKQIRTREDNIICITEKRYYNDNMKPHDEIAYDIAPNINNDPYAQLTSTGKLDNHYIPYGGVYNSISRETYLDYMHQDIDDKKLFENYKSLAKRPLI